MSTELKPKVVDYREVPADVFAGDGAQGASIRWMISQKDGAPNFAMRMIDIAPGGHTPCHSHPGEHEVFVWSGRGELRLAGGESKVVVPGTVAFVPEMTEHQFVNFSDTEKLEFICVIPNPKK